MVSGCNGPPFSLKIRWNMVQVRDELSATSNNAIEYNISSFGNKGV